MAGSRYDERVRDLLTDAGDAAMRSDWAAVRDLAGAALALAPANDEAERLLAAADRAAPTSGERRQLTVLFSDVVGSTTLAKQHDPELVREVLRSYQETCDRAVRRYEGRIARYIGDGVLAYFGHPVTHEDDARRAVKAGLDLLEGLRPVVEEIRDRYGLELSIRVAVHTGLVVRADMGSSATPDRDAIVGDTPNIAARLQDHAAPGTLVISKDTYELVRGWFLVAPLGPQDLRGIGTIEAYQVVGEAPVDAGVRARADLSPFVGRGDELEVLATAWSDVVGGGAHTAAILGQPGVGKSRLADVLRRRVEGDDGRTLVTSCSTFHRSTALHPVRRLLERVAGIEGHQDPHLALSRLWGSMEGVGMADALPYVADLLDLPPTDWCPAPELEGAKLREHLLRTLVGWVRATAERGPTLILVDDLQWADPTTIELLGLLVQEAIPGVLLLATIRDDAKVPWPSATVVTLDRLSTDDLAGLARRLPEGRALSDEHLEQVIERSDGIPLFLEELLRASSVAQGSGEHTASIPAALRDLLLARFAVPGVDLRLAQLVAAVGTDAALPVVSTASGMSETEVDRQLAALVEAQILVVVPGDPIAYRFRHHLLADLAYDTQLLPARRAAHSAIADVLLLGGPVGAAGGPAVLAHHLEEAGRAAEAVFALTEAAEDAHAIGANAEVLALLERGLGLLVDVDGPERTALEFDLRLLRAANVSSVLGFAAPQVVEDYETCRALVAGDQVAGYLDDPDTDELTRDGLVWAGAGLWATLMLQGQLDEAFEINRSLTAQLNPDRQLHDYFDSARSFVDFFWGDIARAVPGLVRTWELYEEYDVVGRETVPGDVGVSNLCSLSYALALDARPEEARAQSDIALARAHTLPYPRGPFSVCWAECMRAGIELTFGETEASRAHAAVAAEVAERHGFTFWQIVSGFYDAALAMHDGDEDAGARAEGAIGLLHAIGVLVWLPSFHAFVSSIHLDRGEVAASQAHLAQALTMADDMRAHYWSAEIERQQGVGLLALGDEAGVERLRAAVARAEDQGATLHELRARASLCEHTRSAVDAADLAELVEAVGDRAGLEAEVAVARAALAACR